MGHLGEELHAKSLGRGFGGGGGPFPMHDQLFIGIGPARHAPLVLLPFNELYLFLYRAIFSILSCCVVRRVIRSAQVRSL